MRRIAFCGELPTVFVSDTATVSVDAAVAVSADTHTFSESLHCAVVSDDVHRYLHQRLYTEVALMRFEPSPVIAQAERDYLSRSTDPARNERVVNDNITCCDKCGAELRVGMFPFCKGNPSDHGYGVNSAIGDDIPGGIEIRHGLCNIDGSPRVYYSHSEIRREAEKRGLTNVVTHVPKPGSDRSPHTSRWI